MLWEMEALSGGDLIFQQDGTRFNIAHDIIAYLQEHTPDFIKPKDWPPNSCDPNDCHYAIWSELETKLHRGKPYANLDDMKDALVQVWKDFPQEYINI